MKNIQLILLIFFTLSEIKANLNLLQNEKEVLEIAYEYNKVAISSIQMMSIEPDYLQFLMQQNKKLKNRLAEISNEIATFEKQEKLEQIKNMKVKQEEFRKKLNAIPGFQKRLVELQSKYKTAINRQENMQKLYKQACKNESNCESFPFRDMHNQIMNLIDSYKKNLEKYIFESESMINDKELLENSEAYVNEAVKMLEESIQYQK